MKKLNYKYFHVKQSILDKVDSEKIIITREVSIESRTSLSFCAGSRQWYELFMYIRLLFIYFFECFEKTSFSCLYMKRIP